MSGANSKSVQTTQGSAVPTLQVSCEGQVYKMKKPAETKKKNGEQKPTPATKPPTPATEKAPKKAAPSAKGNAQPADWLVLFQSFLELADSPKKCDSLSRDKNMD